MRKYAIFASVIGIIFFTTPYAANAVQVLAKVTCSNGENQRDFRIGWDNSTQFFADKGYIPRLFCEGGYAQGFNIYVKDDLIDTSLGYYNGTIPAPKIEPIPVPTPSPAAESTTAPSAEAPTPTPSPEPSQSPKSTPQTESQTAPSSSPSPEPSPSVSSDGGSTATSETPTAVETPTATVDPTPAPTPAPAPEPIPAPAPVPVVEPAPVPAPTPEPTLAPAPEPVPEPAPEPAPAPAPEPSPEPSPAPAPAPEPSPSPAPEPAPEPAPVPSLEPSAPSAPPAPAEPSTSPIQEVVSIGSVDVASLPSETLVQLDNGVVLTAGVVVALQLFDDPTQLISAIFTNPAQAFKALANVGADMTPETRATAQKTIIASVIAGGIATQSATSIAAGYRRKP